MARAKQTNRAEARRRYRQAQTPSTADTEGSPGPDDSTQPSSGGGRPASSTAGRRPSLTGAFREAYHPVHLLEDLRALPGLLTLAQRGRIPFTRTTIAVPWFLVSAFLVILGFAALLTTPGITAGSLGPVPSASVAPAASVAPSTGAATGAPTASPAPAASQVAASSGPTASAAPTSPTTPQSQSPGIGGLLFQLLSLPPGGPTLPILLVGFMATRASYLQGFLIGLLDLILVGLYVALVPGAVAQTPSSIADILVSAAVTGLPTSILFAGAAAWYRRFLYLSSPRRMQPAKTSSRGRSGGRSTRR